MEYERTWLFQRFAQYARPWRVSKHMLQNHPPRIEKQPTKVLTIHFEHVERYKARAMATASGPERVEIVMAVWAKNDRFTVQNNSRSRETSYSLNNAGERMCPVQAVAGQQAPVSALFVGHDAVAVALDFMSSYRSARRLAHKGRSAWLNQTARQPQAVPGRS